MLYFSKARFSQNIFSHSLKQFSRKYKSKLNRSYFYTNFKISILGTRTEGDKRMSISEDFKEISASTLFNNGPDPSLFIADPNPQIENQKFRIRIFL